jgi:hypothetical protein
MEQGKHPTAGTTDRTSCRKLFIARRTGFASFWPFSHAKVHRPQQDTQIGCQAFQGNVHRQGIAYPQRKTAFAPEQVGETEAETGQISARSRFRRRPHTIQSAVFLNGRSVGLPRASRLTELVSPRIKTNNSRFQGARSRGRGRLHATCHKFAREPGAAQAGHQGF